MTTPVDIGYVVGFTIGMLIEVGWKAIGLVVSNPLSHMNLLLQTQSSDPDVINGHTKHFAMTLSGIKFWYKQRGFTGVCRMVPFDVLTPSTLSVDAGGLFTLCNPFYPIETLRTILASDVSTKLWGKTRSQLVSFTEIKEVLSHLHPFVYFSGYVTNVIGTICYRLVYFGSYGVLRETEYAKKDDTSSFLVAQIAVTAGFLAKYPFETISRRMQVQACLSPSDRVYHNAWDCLQKIVSIEGIPGLYKGVGLSLLRTVVTGTLMLLVWHSVQRENSSSSSSTNNDDDSSMIGNILNHEDRVSDPVVRTARLSSGRQPPLEMLWFHVQWTNGNVDSWEPYSRVKNTSILNQYAQDHGLVTSESILSGMTQQKDEGEADEGRLGLELEARKARVKAALARARMSLS